MVRCGASFLRCLRTTVSTRELHNATRHYARFSRTRSATSQKPAATGAQEHSPPTERARVQEEYGARDQPPHVDADFFTSARVPRKQATGTPNLGLRVEETTAPVDPPSQPHVPVAAAADEHILLGEEDAANEPTEEDIRSNIEELHEFLSTTTDVEASWRVYEHLRDVGRHGGPPLPVPLLRRMIALMGRARPHRRVYFLRLLNVCNVLRDSGETVHVDEWNSLIACAARGQRRKRVEDYEASLHVFHDMLSYFQAHNSRPIVAEEPGPFRQDDVNAAADEALAATTEDPPEADAPLPEADALAMPSVEALVVQQVATPTMTEVHVPVTVVDTPTAPDTDALVAPAVESPPDDVLDAPKAVVDPPTGTETEAYTEPQADAPSSGADFAPSAPDQTTLPTLAPDLETFHILLHVAILTASQKAVKHATSLLLQSGWEPTYRTHTIMLAYYSKQHRTNAVRDTVVNLLSAGVTIDTSVVNVCLWTYAKEGSMNIAMSLYQSLQANSSLKTTDEARAAIDDGVQQLLGFCIPRDVQPNAVTYRMLAQAMAYHGDLYGALNVFRDFMQSPSVLAADREIYSDSLDGTTDRQPYASLMPIYRSLFLGFARHAITPVATLPAGDVLAAGMAAFEQQSSPWNLANFEALFDTFVELDPRIEKPTERVVYWVIIAIAKTSGSDMRKMLRVMERMQAAFGVRWRGRLLRLLDSTTRGLDTGHVVTFPDDIVKRGGSTRRRRILVS